MAKKHKKQRITTVRIGDKPTQERQNHNGGVEAETVDRGVNGKILVKRYKAVWECPLDAYLGRGAISELEHLAGLKFRNAYLRAVLRLKIADIGAGCRGDLEMAALTPIYSEKLLNDAYAALSPKQKAIVIDVCGHDEVAGDTAKMKTLHRGLEKLCDVWKINQLGYLIV